MWREDVGQIEYASSVDGTMQPAMFSAPITKEKVPLLVGLHTWSNDCFHPSSSTAMADWCAEKNWCFIYPNFRGPNWTSEAMGSDLVVGDIVDAVEYAKSKVAIDTDRINLVGGSGGGYAALLMAGRAPEIWAGVSAWCPIVDLRKWHAECTKSSHGYNEHIEKAAGGDPSTCANAAEECVKRSAITYLAQAKGVSIDIATGIHDGHFGSVPVSHALEGFNAVAASDDTISDSEISYFVTDEAVPGHLTDESLTDELYGDNTPLFRRESGNARITIFEGGHDFLPAPALNWLESQRKSSDSVWAINADVTASSKAGDVALGH
ncbi:MAG: prolyl oligopeptidase family serine peptidase [Victivallales bacterium]|nr:prolyl oligopeptidase family serine peptidase [Victivallales bacterium]